LAQPVPSSGQLQTVTIPNQRYGAVGIFALQGGEDVKRNPRYHYSIKDGA